MYSAVNYVQGFEKKDKTKLQSTLACENLRYITRREMPMAITHKYQNLGYESKIVSKSPH
jgi:hypothetical protein